MKKKIRLVCVHCGHDISRCGEGSSCEKIHRRPMYFCGNCGEYGSHTHPIEAGKWKKARKILGLSPKLNSY